jgi:hypothetical protein
VNAYRLEVKAKIARAFCKEKAIDCGYAALAAAIEGKAWERSRYINLMRRFVAFANVLDSVPVEKNTGSQAR